MTIKNEVITPVLADTVHKNSITGLERRKTADGYELCSQLFPDGKRTIKYLIDESTRIPVQYTFAREFSEKVWRYDPDSMCWYQREDKIEEHPWRGTFGFDSDGQFFMRDDHSLWLLNRNGSEYRSRTDELGVEAAVRFDKSGICIYARCGSREWNSEDGKIWSETESLNTVHQLTMHFELNLNGDFVVVEEKRTEIHHRDGSKTVRLEDYAYTEKEGRVTLRTSNGEELGEFVDYHLVDELPNSDRFFKSRVINESSRPILVGAKDADGSVKIHVLDARSSTPFSKNPYFIVEDPRFQVKVIDGRLLVPYQLPLGAIIFKLGNQKLKVTNESWGMVLLGWPIAGRDTISGIATDPVKVALRGPSKLVRKNRSVESPRFPIQPRLALEAGR